MIGHGRRPQLADQAEHLAVGEELERDYGEAMSLITGLRRLKDGRRWSLITKHPESKSTTYLVRRVE